MRWSSEAARVHYTGWQSGDTWQVAVRAQYAGKVPTVGYLGQSAPSTEGQRLTPARTGLDRGPQRHGADGEQLRAIVQPSCLKDRSTEPIGLSPVVPASRLGQCQPGPLGAHEIDPGGLLPKWTR